MTASGARSAAEVAHWALTLHQAGVSARLVHGFEVAAQLGATDELLDAVPADEGDVLLRSLLAAAQDSGEPDGFLGSVRRMLHSTRLLGAAYQRAEMRASA